jgi:hypothetical protein
MIKIAIKIYFFFIITLLANKVAAQEQVTITPSGIGKYKIGMNLEELNLLLTKKISIKKERFGEVYGAYTDTVFITVKGVSLRLIMQHETEFESNAEGNMVLKRIKSRLINIYSSDAKISGIKNCKIGDNKFDLVRLLDGNRLLLFPEPNKGKEYSGFSLYEDKTGFRLYFHFKNNKLYALESVDIEEYD